MNADTVIHARWVVPVEPRGTVHEGWAVAVGDGRIAALLPSAQARARYPQAQHIELPEHVLIPGLVNAHTHAAMVLMRGLADDLPLMTWLNQHIWPVEGRWVSPAMVRDGTLLAIAEMLRGGTTCFNDMYFFPDEAARCAEQSGMRAVVGLIVVDFPTAWARDADEYLHKGLEVHDRLRGSTLVRTAFAPHAPYTVADRPLEQVAMYAEELDVPIHMHVHETADEIAQSLTHHGRRPLARLHDLGLVSPRLVGVHMTQLEPAEIDAYAAAGAHVVHCPESNLKLASGFCPAQRLLDAGINLALGTDGAASNNDLFLLGEARTAALLAKGVAGDAAALPAARALELATLGGARALGLDDLIGSLLVGKAADLVAVSLAGVETQPVYHPVSQLVYAAGRDRVTDVWVAGRHLLKGRQLTTVDEEDVLGRAGQWRTKIKES